MAEPRAGIERHIIQVGTRPSENADERDATRVAMEESVERCVQISLELVECRGCAIFVVAEGSELLAWREQVLKRVKKLTWHTVPKP